MLPGDIDNFSPWIGADGNETPGDMWRSRNTVPNLALSQKDFVNPAYPPIHQDHCPFPYFLHPFSLTQGCSLYSSALSVYSQLTHLKMAFTTDVFKPITVLQISVLIQYSADFQDFTLRIYHSVLDFQSSYFDKLAFLELNCNSTSNSCCNTDFRQDPPMCQ